MNRNYVIPRILIALFHTVWGFLDMIPTITIKVHCFSESFSGNLSVSHNTQERNAATDQRMKTKTHAGSNPEEYVLFVQ